MANRNFGLGRRISIDEKDRAFLMTRKLAAPGTPLPTRKTWRLNARSLDQGATGTCVGHAWYNFLRCEPIQTSGKGMPTPFDIYRKAVAIDVWPENDGEAGAPESELQSGTSIRAGAEAVMGYGRLKSYLWAFSLQPALEFVLTQGSCVIGVNFYSSMFEPDAEGIIRITPRARIEGGHAMLWRGADVKRGLALLENSWSDEWGLKGGAWISLRDMERLIHEDGEVCAAVEKKLKAAQVG